MKKRILGLLTILCLGLCLWAPTAYAESGEKLQTGDHIYLGEYTDDRGFEGAVTAPISWLVLDAKAMNTGTPGVFLLSQYVVQRGGVAFDEELAVWKGSLAQQWCTDFAATAFTDGERSLIPAVSKEEDALMGYALNWGKVALENEQVFFLSAWEAKDYIGPEGGEGLTAQTPDGWSAYWWFRSPSFIHPDYVGLVLHGNDIHDSLVYTGWGARPATNLDLRGAILLVPAQGSPAVGKLSAPQRPEDGNWKLIVPDKTRQLELAGAKLEGETLTVSYAGANTGEGEYLSLLVRDAAGKDLLYGRLCETKASAGELAIDLAALQIPEDGQLFLFSEHEGGEFYTNAASPLCPVSCRLRLTPGAGSGEETELDVPFNGLTLLPEADFTAPKGQCFDHWEKDGEALDPAREQRFTADAVLTAAYRDIPVTEIRVDRDSGSIRQLQRLQLTASTRPENAAETTLRWQSSKPLVCAVDQNGKLCGILPGDAVVTVTADGSEASAQLPVHVAFSPILLGVLLLILAAVILLIARKRRGKKK